MSENDNRDDSPGVSPSGAGDRAHGPAVLYWLLLAVVSLIFTLIEVHYSLERGRLSRTPFPDDIGYINDAIARLDSMYAHGWIRLIPDYYRLPPHSPLSTFLAMGGMSVLGIVNWAPYLMNAVLVLLLLWSVDYLMHGATRLQRVLVCGYVLTIPFAAIAVTEFRPDPLWGLATGMAIMLALRRPLHAASPRYLLVCGTWCAVALLAKPATSPLTLCTVGLAWILAALCDRADSPRVPLTRLAVVLALCAAPAVVLAAPHYLLARHEIHDYIVENSFGPHRDLWHVPGGRMFQAGYYFLYDGGKFMLGSHVWVLMIPIAGGMFFLFLDRRVNPWRLRRAVCMAVVTLACYVFLAINPHKNGFLGAEFDALLILGWVAIVHTLVTGPVRLARQLGNVAIVGSLIAGLAGGRFPPAWGGEGAETVAQTNHIVRAVSDCVFDNVPVNGHVFVTGFGWVNEGAIRYLVRRREKSIFCADLHREDDLRLFRPALDDADVIVAAEPGVSEFQSRLPSYGILNETLAMARGRPDFREVGRVRSQTGKSFFVFARPATFGGWNGSVGIAQTEDDDHSSDRRLRWGIGPHVILSITADGPRTCQLIVKVRSPVEGQEINLTLDGKAIAVHRFGTTNQFESIRLPIDLSVGEHEIELQFKKTLPAMHENGLSRAVQFEELRVN